MKLKLAVLIGLLLAIASQAFAQEVLLDEVVRAGELTLFRSYKDANTYYYVSNKARLAATADGQPEFSFLKFATNIKPTTGDPTQAEGGGIVHFLVELGVTPEMLQEA